MFSPEVLVAPRALPSGGTTTPAAPRLLLRSWHHVFLPHQLQVGWSGGAEHRGGCGLRPHLGDRHGGGRVVVGGGHRGGGSARELWLEGGRAGELVASPECIAGDLTELCLGVQQGLNLLDAHLEGWSVVGVLAPAGRHDEVEPARGARGPLQPAARPHVLQDL